MVSRLGVSAATLLDHQSQILHHSQTPVAYIHPKTLTHAVMAATGLH